MKILICGDSYSITDPSYPGLHWSEKILNYSPDVEVINLAFGGCSNALIALQLLQGLRFSPDFIIFSFTNDDRYEFDNDVSAMPNSLSSDEISNYIKTRYITNKYKLDSRINESFMQWLVEAASPNFEKLKNYFYILFCLMTAEKQKINFCFTLGGFEYKQDYTMLLNSNFIKNLIVDYKDKELMTNLWSYPVNPHSFFHVTDDKAQTLFANECISHIEKLNGQA